MAEITINKAEFETLQECEVGEPLILNGTVTAIDGDMLTIDVTEAKYDEEAEAEEPAPAPSSRKSPVASIGIPMKKQYA